jgi:hypothetical protein
MAVSKKLRFEVFKRDGFQCCYCGKTPPEVVLEIDHIDPKSRGGKDGINNLLTACFDCNRGKKDVPLDKIPSKLSDNLEVLKQKEDQLKEYRKFINKIEARIGADIREIDQLYQNVFPGWKLSEEFKLTSVKRFLKSLPLHEVLEAMQIATTKFSYNKDRALPYFCGICWNKIKASSR